MRPAFAVVTALLLSAFASPAPAMDLNSFRAANGRKPLHYDFFLAGLARSHAADMARRGRLDHAGFVRERVPLGARAENVAYGCPDEACAIQQWIKSPPHRVNMLRREVGSYGLASAVAPSGRQYWVMELGGEGEMVPIRARPSAYLRAAPQPAPAKPARKPAR